MTEYLPGTRLECPREGDVFEAIAFHRIDGVRDHIAACAICADIAAVAGALRADHSDACREAQIPTAAIVWWRSTIRARAEAARTVSQPITVAQGIAGASAIGLAISLVTIMWPSLSWVVSTTDLVARLGAGRQEISSMSALVLQNSLPLLLGIVACLLVAPVAVYVALSDE